MKKENSSQHLRFVSEQKDLLISQLKADLTDLKEEYSQLQEKCGQLQNKLLTQQKDLDFERERSSQLMNQQYDMIDQLQHDLDDLTHRERVNYEALQQQQRINAAQEEQIIMRDRQIEKYSLCDFEQINQQMQSMIITIDKKDQIIEQLTHQLEYNQIKNSENNQTLRAELNISTEELQSTRDELQKARKYIQQLQLDLEDLNRQQQNQQKQKLHDISFIQLRRNHQQALDELEELNRNYRLLEKQNLELAQRIEYLERQDLNHYNSRQIQYREIKDRLQGSPGK